MSLGLLSGNSILNETKHKVFVSYHHSFTDQLIGKAITFKKVYFTFLNGVMDLPRITSDLCFDGLNKLPVSLVK